MKQEWKINEGTTEHIVTYIQEEDIKENKLYVDGNSIEIETTSYIKGLGFEQTFYIDEKNIN